MGRPLYPVNPSRGLGRGFATAAETQTVTRYEVHRAVRGTRRRTRPHPQPVPPTVSLWPDARFGGASRSAWLGVSCGGVGDLACEQYDAGGSVSDEVQERAVGPEEFESSRARREQSASPDRLECHRAVLYLIGGALDRREASREPVSGIRNKIVHVERHDHPPSVSGQEEA